MVGCGQLAEIFPARPPSQDADGRAAFSGYVEPIEGGGNRIASVRKDRVGGPNVSGQIALRALNEAIAGCAEHAPVSAAMKSGRTVLHSAADGATEGAGLTMWPDFQSDARPLDMVLARMLS